MDGNAFNTRIMETVQASGRAFLTQAVLGGTFWLRANVLHFGTTEADLDALLATVRVVAEGIAAESPS
jgi:hypothetical protein